MAYRRTLSVEFDGHKVARQLRKAGARIEVGMGTVTRAVVSRTVAASHARGRSLGGVHAHVVNQGAIHAQSGNNIRLDPRRSPAVMGAVFGGGRRPTTQQFPPWRGAGREAGYMVYPDLRQQERQIDTIVTNLIDQAL